MFNATLSNATGTINWALSPNVGTLSATTGTSVTYTPPATVASSTAVQLTATSGTLTATANITVNPPASVTVAGKVIDFIGQGVPGLVVRIGSTNATTAADGSFSISGVTAPYDAAVINSTSKVVVVYKGLTRADPTLVAINLGLAVTSPKTATFSGNLSGGAGFPNPANHDTRVFFGSPETLLSSASTAGPAYGPTNAAWFGPDSTIGKVYALQWQFDPGTNLPTDYKGFGERNLTLSNGGNFPNQDVALANLAEDTVSGTITVPSGYTLNLRRLHLRVAPGAGFLLVNQSSPSTNYSFTTPRIAGATVALLARAASASREVWAWRSGVGTNASGVSITMSTAPGLSLPVNNATGVTINTDFQTTGFSGGVKLFFFDSSMATNPDFYVVTTANTTNIPDLSAVGLGLPTTGTAAYEWQGFGIAPVASADAAAGPGGFLKDFVNAVLLFNGVGPEADGAFGQSEKFNFTTP